MGSRSLGEFEQLVLLAILQQDQGAHALAVLEELDERAGREVSRGTLYKTLERLEAKGYVRWRAESGPPERGGHARRRFSVTETGMDALRESRAVFLRMWDGLEDVAGEARG
jgi:DNA-binding PadR family transcriptional regulator